MLGGGGCGAGEERGMFFTILGYGLVVVLLMRVVPQSTVVVGAVALPLGMGWVSWSQIASGPAFYASHGLGLAIAGWAALSDLKRAARFLRNVQWHALWHMMRGGEVIALSDECDQEVDEELEDEEPAGERA